MQKRVLGLTKDHSNKVLLWIVRDCMIYETRLPLNLLCCWLGADIGDVVQKEEGDCGGQAPRAELDVGDGAGDAVEEGGW